MYLPRKRTYSEKIEYLINRKYDPRYAVKLVEDGLIFKKDSQW